ncbi:MAG: hypothetical protein H0W61_01155 [Bacteroidetes bacterium]|nr:hypothetical protein [Bacteroidota bacterium]
MKRQLNILAVFLIFSIFQAYPQKTLQVLVTRFGKIKKFEFYTNDMLEYKLKGRFFYRTDKIVNMSDSLLVFANDSVVKLNQIKAVRIHKGGHFAKTMQEVFFIGGIGFLALNTANNAINNTSPVVDNRAVYIAGALVGTSLIIRFLSTRHVRFSGKNMLRVIDPEFAKLNGK